MKNILKIAMGALVLTTATSFAGNYPFPQNKKHPYGTTVDYASTEMIKEHYNLWKGTWYQASSGWVLAPEGDCSTVSEAIAYGMLITVYMDEKDVFDKLYSVWTSNANATGGGMNWRINNGNCPSQSSGTGSASDADFDAALALVMASKQWNNSSYLDAAKNLISWIGSNDIKNNKIMPGNQWGDAFNPSYATTANFQVFQSAAGGSWTNVINQAYTDLQGCQDNTTGLVPDWCTWDHKPTLTAAAVSNAEGFYDDAARTPWRMAWAYYWFGDTKAQAFNKKIVDWLIPATHTASGVNSGYKYENSTYVVDQSPERTFVSSTFSGGLGLAASSVEGEKAESYLKSVYNVLKQKKSCSSAKNCTSGEKYYPATLNVLYLLLISGNMPNFLEMDKFTSFTPDTTKASSLSDVEGVRMKKGDTTVGISGFWNWGAYHDKWENTGTKMSPDSGLSPLYVMNNELVATATMSIGPEPEWGTPDADAGHYPSAGIAMSFLKSEGAVDFSALGIKSIRMTYSSKGPMRFALLNTASKAKGEGTEPGCFLPVADTYQEFTFSLKINQSGKETDDCSGTNGLTFMSWVVSADNPANDKTITESDMFKTASGIKIEVKVAQGGEGAITIKSIEFLDASGNVVDPVKLVGFAVPEFDVSRLSDNPDIIDDTPSSSNSNTNSSSSVAGFVAANVGLNMAKVSVAGMNIFIDGAKAGADIAVFSMQGKVIASGKATFGNATFTVPTKGSYLVRVGGKVQRVNVK